MKNLDAAEGIIEVLTFLDGLSGVCTKDVAHLTEAATTGHFTDNSILNRMAFIVLRLGPNK
jgi:hypothetical protein